MPNFIDCDKFFMLSLAYFAGLVYILREHIRLCEKITDLTKHVADLLKHNKVQDHGRKERQSDTTDNHSPPNAPKTSAKIQVPEIDPANFSGLKRPPRPPGGFGAPTSSGSTDSKPDADS